MKAFVQFAVLLICCIIAVLGDYLCRVDGVSYANGTNLGTEIDGCNNCDCYDAEIYCGRTCQHTPLKCQLDGQEYNETEAIPPKDCKRCTCYNGKVLCDGCPS